MRPLISLYARHTSHSAARRITRYSSPSGRACGSRRSSFYPTTTTTTHHLGFKSRVRLSFAIHSHSPAACSCLPYTPAHSQASLSIKCLKVIMCGIKNSPLLPIRHMPFVRYKETACPRTLGDDSRERRTGKGGKKASGVAGEDTIIQSLQQNMRQTHRLTE